MNNEKHTSASQEVLTQSPSDIEKAFAVDAFDETLRTQQKNVWDELSKNSSIDLDTYHKQADDITVNYLASAGVTPETDSYASFYNVARKYSWDQMSDTEWSAGYQNPERPNDYLVPGRTKLQLEHEQLFGYQISSDGDKKIPLSNEQDVQNGSEEEQAPEKTLEELQSEIDTLNEQVSGTFAKRMKVGVFRRKKKAELQEELDAKKAELSELTASRNTMLVAQLRSENLTDEQIVEKLAEQSNAENVKFSQSQRDAMVGKTMRGRVMEAYANQPRYMKIAIGLFGATVASAAVIGTAGLTGVAGASLLVGTRLSRSYALNRAKLYETPTDPAPIQFKNGDEYRGVDEVLADANSYNSTMIDERIDKGDKIKRRAVIATLGSAALIGAGAAVEHWDTIKDVAQSTKEYASGLFDNDENTIGLQPNMPNDSIDGDKQGHIGIDHGPQGEPVESLPETGGDYDVDVSQFADAHEIQHGEGWYQTFGELGVSNPYDQARLLNDDVLMGKLSNMGVAYPDANAGGWGINMTANGQMPPEALELIRQTATQNSMALSR